MLYLMLIETGKSFYSESSDGCLKIIICNRILNEKSYLAFFMMWVVSRCFSLLLCVITAGFF